LLYNYYDIFQTNLVIPKMFQAIITNKNIEKVEILAKCRYANHVKRLIFEIDIFVNKLIFVIYCRDNILQLCGLICALHDCGHVQSYWSTRYMSLMDSWTNDSPGCPIS